MHKRQKLEKKKKSWTRRPSMHMIYVIAHYSFFAHFSRYKYFQEYMTNFYSSK